MDNVYNWLPSVVGVISVIITQLAFLYVQSRNRTATSLEKMVKVQQEELGKLSLELTKQQHSNYDLRALNYQFEYKIEQLTREIRTLTMENETLRRENIELREEVLKMRTELAGLRSQLAGQSPPA